MVARTLEEKLIDAVEELVDRVGRQEAESSGTSCAALSAGGAAVGADGGAAVDRTDSAGTMGGTNKMLGPRTGCHDAGGPGTVRSSATNGASSPSTTSKTVPNVALQELVGGREGSSPEDSELTTFPDHGLADEVGSPEGTSSGPPARSKSDVGPTGTTRELPGGSSRPGSGGFYPADHVVAPDSSSSLQRLASHFRVRAIELFEGVVAKFPSRRLTLARWLRAEGRFADARMHFEHAGGASSPVVAHTSPEDSLPASAVAGALSAKHTNLNPK